jgi:hypothetical protein
MRCAAFQRLRRTQAGWRRCARPARCGRFCRAHSEAVQGAMLGLAVLEWDGRPELTPGERFYGNETVERAARHERNRKNKKSA